MADVNSSKPPFWSSLPGMFTGLGAVIVATTGLITALYTTGIIGSKASADPKGAPVNTAAAVAATPAASNAENERYKALTGKWEVIEKAAQDQGTWITWRYEASVSGNVLTLTGKIFAIGNDKNLSDDEERMSSTFVMTLIGAGGLGEYRIKRLDGTTWINDATIKLGDDLSRFEAKVDGGGQTYTYNGRKL